METLPLTLKKKWFDMILSGEKKEEYREIKPYWIRRLTKPIHEDMEALHYDEYCNTLMFDIGELGVEKILELFDCEFAKIKTIKFYNGNCFSDKLPHFTIECLGIEIGNASPELSDNWRGMVFIIKLGEIICK